MLGTAWQPSVQLVRIGADLASALGVHLVCAFVDPESYLTELGPLKSRTGASLDPVPNADADFPSSETLGRISRVLGPPGEDWTFRVLYGDVALALARLAASVDASLLIVGGPRPGRLAGMAQLLEVPVSASLIRTQPRPVMVLPHASARGHRRIQPIPPDYRPLI